MVAIIILNWNGHIDTIACLESIFKSDYKDFCVIVGDNGSKDDSLCIIEAWCKDNKHILRRCQLGEEPVSMVYKEEIILYDLKENHGFAKGNNLIIKFVAKSNVDYFFLLNNDTEVTSDYMLKLLNVADSHSDYSLLVPQIRLYYKPTHIWNCGGNIKYGLRRYHYGGRPFSDIKETDLIDCTFITGCAALFDRSILNAENELFTEKFFFGEEDFELSLRLKKEGKKMACVVPSVIYHKVGSSTRKTGALKRNYIYYLNRFINIRHYYSKIGFIFWELCYMPYVFMVLQRGDSSFTDCLKFISRLHKECRLYDGVSKSYFEHIMSPNFEI